jgi:hypothetical protein
MTNALEKKKNFKWDWAKWGLNVFPEKYPQELSHSCCHSPV